MTRTDPVFLRLRSTFSDQDWPELTIEIVPSGGNRDNVLAPGDTAAVRVGLMF
jgi:hypothetical protein